MIKSVYHDREKMCSYYICSKNKEAIRKWFKQVLPIPGSERFKKGWIISCLKEGVEKHTQTTSKFSNPRYKDLEEIVKILHYIDAIIIEWSPGKDEIKKEICAII